MSKRLMHKANVDTLVYHKSQDHLSPPDHKVNIDRIFQGLLTLINQTRITIGLDPYTEDDKIILYAELCYTEKQHQGRWRKDGKTPYFEHLLGTIQNMIVDEHLTSPLSMLSGLHHDDLEDLSTVQRNPSKLFAPPAYAKQLTLPRENLIRLQERVRNIVLGVTKIKQAQGTPLEDNEQTFARLLTTIRDHGPRVGYVKLADRANNSDTFSILSPEKQKEKARETTLVYVPLAHLFKLKKVEEHLMQGSLICLNPKLQKQYKQLLTRRINLFDQQYKMLIMNLFCRKEADFLVMDEIESIDFVPRGIAQTIRDANTSIPLESLRLEDLKIDELDPCIETVVLTKKPEYIPLVKARIIERLSSPHETSGHLKMDDLQEEGSLFKIFRTDLGGRIRIRVNDAVSEAKTTRGILANLTDDTTSLGLRESIDQILLTAGETRKGIFDIAVEELLQPRIIAMTMKGKEIELPMNATALDFAAKIHKDILIGAQSVIVADDLWNTNSRDYSLFSTLPHGVTVIIDSCLMKKENTAPHPENIKVDPGWLLFCNASTRKILHKYLRKTEKRSKEYGVRFINTVCQIFNGDPTKIILDVLKDHYPQYHTSDTNTSDPVENDDRQELNQIYMDIGAGKINLIEHMSQLTNIQECRKWQITVSLPNQPGELEKLLDSFKHICNVEKVSSFLTKSKLGADNVPMILLEINFSPPDLPKHKLLSSYMILKSFLKLHYEGYHIQAIPLRKQEGNI